MLSPDPVTQAPEFGQNYNRYTYAFNNPLKFKDPSGFSSEFAHKWRTWAEFDPWEETYSDIWAMELWTNNWTPPTLLVVRPPKKEVGDTISSDTVNPTSEITATGLGHAISGAGSYFEGVMGTFVYAARRNGLLGEDEMKAAIVEGQIFMEIIPRLLKDEKFRSWAAEFGFKYSKRNPNKVIGRLLTASVVTAGTGPFLGTTLTVAAVNGNIRNAIANGATTAKDVVEAIVGGDETVD